MFSIMRTFLIHGNEQKNAFFYELAKHGESV